MRRTPIVVVAILSVGLVVTWWFARDRSGAPQYAGQASLDIGTWSAHSDARIGWSLRYPTIWHLQVAEPDPSEVSCNDDTIVVTNFDGDLHHPDLGGASCTGAWDMRQLRSNFVIVQMEVPADVNPGPEFSQHSMPLSLGDALEGDRIARFGMPKGVWIPVYIDADHQYFVRVWHGPDASSRDMTIADRIVGSMRFET
jgi:hypothetical protein